MMFRLKLAFTFVLLFILSMSGLSCAPSFEVLSPGADSRDGFGSDPGPITTSPYAAFISGGPYDKMQVVDYDAKKKELSLLVPLGMGLAVENLSYPIAELPGVFVQTLNKSNYNYVALRLPSKYLSQRLDKFPADGLPNGSPLPGVPEERLAHLVVPLKNSAKLNVYLGQNTVATLFESNFDPYANMTLPLTNEAGTKILGYFATMAASGMNLGGFYLMTSMPTDF
ncbi:MAG: hypothetical protein ACLGGX_01085 [Bdellovibrionia bacterium]